MTVVYFGYILVLVVLIATAIVSIRKTIQSPHQNRFLSLFKFWFIASAIFCIVAAAWPALYIDLRLEYLGAGISTEPAAWLDSVSSENKTEAEQLYWANTGMRWPISASIWFVLFGIPWSGLLVACAKTLAKYSRGSLYET